MNKILSGLSMVFIWIILFSGVNPTLNAESNKYENKILVEVGPEKITYSKLEKAFRKNMNRENVNLANVPRDSVMDFLNLYVNYRLKVLDALERGFENDSAVQSDIEQNRKILAESFYYDKHVVEPHVQKMLDRRDWELKVGIVLISNKGKTPNPDTTEAYKKAREALKKLKQGENFEKIVQQYSDDEQTKKNDGIVPAYITSGKVQRPIENAMYAIEEEGEIYPELVKTDYGYFIIKLIEKKPRVKVKARHILLSEGLKEDTAAVEAKADSIIKALQNGADFTEAAQLHSDDAATAMKGGYFGAWYSRSSGFEGSGRNVVPEVEEKIFELEDGEISGKVYSQLGIHIIKRDSTKEFDKEDQREEIRKTYKRLYFEQDKQAHLDPLKEAYKLQKFDNVINRVMSLVDTTQTTNKENWDAEIPESIREKPVFMILDKEYSVEYLIDKMNNMTELKGLSTNWSGFNRAIDKVTDDLAFKEASKDLEEEFPKFKALMDEFRDGILLFRVEALEVWDNLKFDSTLAREYYDTTKQRYKTNPKYDLSEIYVLSDSLAKLLYGRIQDGEDFAKLAKEFTQRDKYREKEGNWGFVSVEDNKLAKKAYEKDAKPGDVLEPMEYEKGYTIVKINDYQNPRIKKFEEAVSDFAPEFQDLMQKKLTQKWLAKVKEKFPVDIKKENIKKIFSN